MVQPFHNPTLLPIPPHLVKTIQNGKYIDLGDLLPEALSEAFDKAQQEVKRGYREVQMKHSINTPIDWGLAFSTFAAVMQHTLPARVCTPTHYLQQYHFPTGLRGEGESVAEV